MLPQANRLRADQDIKTLFAKGKSVFGEAFGLRYARSRWPLVRVGVAVGTKVSKKAVVRNRLKRRIMAFVHRHLAALPAGYDLMFLVKPSAVGRSPADLDRDLLDLLKKAKFFR